MQPATTLVGSQTSQVRRGGEAERTERRNPCGRKGPGKDLGLGHPVSDLPLGKDKLRAPGVITQLTA
jgi:hypothetical protein